MNNTDRELINAYISGTLSDDKRHLVEKRIAEDPDFRRRLLAKKESQVAPGAITNKNSYQNSKRGAQSKPVEPVAPRSNRGWLIAAVVALAIAGAFYLVNTQQPQAGDLFAEYFEPYPLSAYTVATEGEETVPAALEAYRLGDFEEAVSRFETTEATASAAPSFTFYQALSLLGAEQSSAAIPLLQRLSQQEDAAIIAQPAEWYLALAYLHDGQKDKAVETLDRIAGQPNHEMNNKAARLRADLRS